MRSWRVPLGVVEPAAVRRGRVAVCLLFLLYGTILGAWTARIPAIKQGLGLGDGQLSIGLLAFAAGAITGMQAIGRLVDRYGSTKVMIPAALADAGLLVLPAYAANLPTLAVSLFAFGAVHGTLNVAMNVNGVEVQRAWRRPIMSSFHAVYSIGGVLGAAVGGLFAYADLSAGATFLAVATAACALAIWAGRWAYTPERAVPGRTDASPAAVPMSGVLFLGVLVFCCLVGEGAAADWSAVYLRDSLGSSAGFAATAYAAFAIAMMAGRLVGDRLAERFGPVALVRGCGLLAAAGFGGALLVGEPVAGVIGFGCLGAGLSCIAPQVFSAAGSNNPAHAGKAIARVASLGFLGFVVGPVVIGVVAELVGLRAALVIPAVLALFVAATATALRPRTLIAGTAEGQSSSGR
jgi:predicted MFS family arabinose efflux permease